MFKAIRVFLQWIQTSVAFKRIYNFLLVDELLDEDMEEPSIDTAVNKTPVLEISNGTFKWDETVDKPSLADINLKVFPGELIAVVGAVGSGKSSLLNAFLNELAVVKHAEAPFAVVHPLPRYTLLGIPNGDPYYCYNYITLHLFFKFGGALGWTGCPTR